MTCAEDKLQFPRCKCAVLDLTKFDLANFQTPEPDVLYGQKAF